MALADIPWEKKLDQEYYTKFVELCLLSTLEYLCYKTQIAHLGIGRVVPLVGLCFHVLERPLLVRLVRLVRLSSVNIAVLPSPRVVMIAMIVMAILVDPLRLECREGPPVTTPSINMYTKYKYSTRRYVGRRMAVASCIVSKPNEAKRNVLRK